MIEIECHKCGKRFLKKPSQVAYCALNFCSASCQHAARKTGKTISCFLCGKKVYKEKRHLSSQKLFCSKTCSVRWHNVEFVASKHGNWKGGQFAYRRILDRSGKYKFCTLCNVIDKRFLIVHHVDHNRGNNSVSNLIWLCNNCHFLVHHYKKEEKRLQDVLMV